PVVHDPAGLELGAIERLVLDGHHPRTDAEHRTQPVRDAAGPGIHRRFGDVLVLDLNGEGVHSGLAADHDAVFTAVAVGRHDDVVDCARVHVLAAHREHVVDPPVDTP